MKINLKAENIEYAIEMTAEEVVDSNKTLLEIAKFLVDNRYEIIGIVKDINEIANAKKGDETNGYTV